MRKKYINSLLSLLFVILIIYATHKSIFHFLGYVKDISIYSLEQLYLFFGIFSVIIDLVLIRVKEKNIDIVGNVFLLLTLVKMMLCFVCGASILKQESNGNSIQKWNFLVLFLVFLTIETIVTIRLLNKNEQA